MSDRTLDVYLNDRLAGQLHQNYRGHLTFSYNKLYLKQARLGISISLPLQETPFEGTVVNAFFSGLLPEEILRKRLANCLGLSEKNTFALLAAVGGDCAGALVLYPKGEKPTTNQDNHAETLDDTQLQELLRLIKQRPMLAGENGYRLSLAGAQNKLAVGFRNGKVLLIKNSPTTHILKPIIDHVKDSTHNELFCMRLAKAIGLEAPVASLHFVGNTPYYLVERYDRVYQKDGTIQRIHQEDFCQAMGVLPEIKYEREGGPTIAACQKIISQHTSQPAIDQVKLLKMIIFNYLIGNADAHGKNFSLLYRNDKLELAPAYDLLSTTVYPDLSKNMAMKIGGKYKPKDVYLRHWHKLVPDTKAAQSAINKQLKTIAAKVEENSLLLKEEFERDNITSPIFEEIGAVIRRRVSRIKLYVK